VRPRLYTPGVRGASPLASTPHTERPFYAGPPGFCKGKNATGWPHPSRAARAACLKTARAQTLTLWPARTAASAKAVFSAGLTRICSRAPSPFPLPRFGLPLFFFMQEL
jgi:hypothetical protein